MLDLWRLCLSSDDGQAGHSCFIVHFKNVRCMETFCHVLLVCFHSSLVALRK